LMHSAQPPAAFQASLVVSGAHELTQVKKD
jgi:hypothetical protein